MGPDDDKGSQIIPPGIIGIGLRLSFLIIVPAIILLVLTPYRSEQFVISLLTLVVGVGLLGIVVLLGWISRRL